MDIQFYLDTCKENLEDMPSDAQFFGIENATYYKYSSGRVFYYCDEHSTWLPNNNNRTGLTRSILDMQMAVKYADKFAIELAVNL